MTALSSPPSQRTPTLADDVDLGRMDGLLSKLKRNMVELILQGDDVTRQMWQMYSVFEEIFGRQTMTTSSNQPLKHVVVGDRLKGSPKSKAPAPKQNEVSASPMNVVSVSDAAVTVAAVSSSTAVLSEIPVSTNSKISTTLPATSVERKSSLTENASGPKQHTPNKTHPKTPTKSSTASTPTSDGQPPTTSTTTTPIVTSSTRYPRTQTTTVPSSLPQGSTSRPPRNAAGNTSNPLLDTIGALATSNHDSDDSDLDIVYQQLRYRARQQRPEHARIRTHRHHQQHIASSDPESIGYAGSNSIDSGYKSLCATPEVSDSLSAPEVRRSASDVSASDSSTTSGRPRSLDGQDGKSAKIKMGTRSIAGKKPLDRSPRHQSGTLNDVTLDHLMYLRQSLRKDRPDPPRSPNDSIPSSVTSSTFRDSDLSPRTVTDEEWRDGSQRSYATYHSGTGSSSGSPIGGSRDGRSSSRCSSKGEDLDHEGGGEGSSDFLLSGVEYYDLESIHEFPPSNSYVTMMEEKTRRYLVAASKRGDPITERQLGQLYRKRSESTQSVDAGDGRNFYYASQARATTREATKMVHQRHHHHRPHHATDSKLTEAAIRVLEMIEDFRMEEAMARSHPGAAPLPYQGASSQMPMPRPGSSASSASPGYPQSPQGMTPRYRRMPGMRSAARPASTGSLMDQDMDVRSVASTSSSYAASAEHHVYGEIMYDLMCERASSERGVPPPVPPDRGRVSRSRLLPVPPMPHQQPYAVDPRRVMVRSHKQKSSNLYSILSSVHGRGNVDRFLEMEWHLAQEREKLPPDFPV